MDMFKSQRHTRAGAGRGVSQANEAAIYPKLTGLCQHEIFNGIIKKLKQYGTEQATYGCLGRSRVHGRPYLSFCPITLLHFRFRS